MASRCQSGPHSSCGCRLFRIQRRSTNSRNGVSVYDGPFIETKELIAGYVVVVGSVPRGRGAMGGRLNLSRTLRRRRWRPFAEVRNQSLQHFGQGIARHVFKDLRTGLCIRSRLAANEDVDGVNDLAVDPGVLAEQTDVRGCVIAASRRAPGPMHRQPLARRHCAPRGNARS